MKLALKRLAPADLTIFQAKWRKGTGNQKSITMNADVFIKQFYPGLPEYISTTGKELAFSMKLYGPGIRPTYSLARKIVRSAGSKNWRLNGEFIHDPEDESGRFDALEPGDFALLLFHGEPVPHALEILFVASAVAEDTDLHAVLSEIIPESSRRSMISLEASDLTQFAAKAHVGLEHSVWRFASDPEEQAILEDASFGNSAAMQKLTRRRGSRKTTSAELAAARERAAKTGSAGEEIVNLHLGAEKNAGRIKNFTWISRENATSPFDFDVIENDGQRVKIEVKSTEGEFERTFHISGAEIAEASRGDERYDLYRVCRMTDEEGTLRVSCGIKAFARGIEDWAAKLPAGVQPDSFAVNPSALNWEPEVNIRRPDEAD